MCRRCWRAPRWWGRLRCAHGAGVRARHRGAPPLPHRARGVSRPVHRGHRGDRPHARPISVHGGREVCGRSCGRVSRSARRRRGGRAARTPLLEPRASRRSRVRGLRPESGRGRLVRRDRGGPRRHRADLAGRDGAADRSLGRHRPPGRGRPASPPARPRRPQCGWSAARPPRLRLRRRNAHHRKWSGAVPGARSTTGLPGVGVRGHSRRTPWRGGCDDRCAHA